MDENEVGGDFFSIQKDKASLFLPGIDFLFEMEQFIFRFFFLMCQKLFNFLLFFDLYSDRDDSFVECFNCMSESSYFMF